MKSGCCFSQPTQIVIAIPSTSRSVSTNAHDEIVSHWHFNPATFKQPRIHFFSASTTLFRLTLWHMKEAYSLNANFPHASERAFRKPTICVARKMCWAQSMKSCGASWRKVLGGRCRTVSFTVSDMKYMSSYGSDGDCVEKKYIKRFSYCRKDNSCASFRHIFIFSQWIHKQSWAQWQSDQRAAKLSYWYVKDNQS